MITYLDLLDSTGSAVRFHGSGEPNRKLTNAEGLPGVFGFSGARDSVINRPSGHGAITRSRWQKAGLVTLEGFINCPTPDQAQAELDELRIPLLDALDAGRLMKWQRGTDGTGVQLQATARLTDDLSVSQDVAGRVLRYQAHLRLDDPRGYSQTLTTATGGTLGTGGGATFARTFPVTFDQHLGGTAAVNNTGTRATPAVFRVYGYAIDATILLVGTTFQIALDGTIAPGDYLEVDVANRTAKLNGTSPAQGMIDGANTTWFDLPRGASTIRLLAGSNDSVTRVDVLFRPAYS